MREKIISRKKIGEQRSDDWTYPRSIQRCPLQFWIKITERFKHHMLHKHSDLEDLQHPQTRSTSQPNATPATATITIHNTAKRPHNTTKHRNPPATATITLHNTVNRTHSTTHYNTTLQEYAIWSVTGPWPCSDKIRHPWPWPLSDVFFFGPWRRYSVSPVCRIFLHTWKL